MKKLMLLVVVLGTVSTSLFAEELGQKDGLEDCIYADQAQRSEADGEVSAEETKTETSAVQGV